ALPRPGPRGDRGARPGADRDGRRGVGPLSPDAIAQRLGVSGPAPYRRCAGRDELVTDPVRDGYRSLADTLRAAAEAGADLAGPAHALRDRALADPQRYVPPHGTPVPGYRAPDDTTAVSAEITAPLDACAAPAPAPATSAAPFTAHLAEHRDRAGGHPAPPEGLRRFLVIRTRVHGVLSLELAGRLAPMRFDPALLFATGLGALTTPGS
ncbi:LOW QUALITY PROTEIN: predicted protein, partial [Streptomyces sp. C]